MKQYYSPPIIILLLITLTLTFNNISDAAIKNVCNSGCEYANLQDAIATATSGDIIRIAQGTYSAGQITIDDLNITIEGGWNQDFSEQSIDPSLTTLLTTPIILNLNDKATQFTLKNLTFSSLGKQEDGLVIHFNYINQTTPIEINLSNIIINDRIGNGIFIEMQGARNLLINITNSIFHNNSNAIILEQSVGPNSALMNIKNCTIVSNQQAGIAIYGNVLANIENSIIWNNATRNNYATTPLPASDIIIGSRASLEIGYSLFGIISNPGQGTFSDKGGNLSGTTQNPLFIDLNNNDFHLSEASPCIDKGTTLHAPNIDFEGDVRPMGQGIDIGADEYNPCINDTIPPAPVYNFNAITSPQNLSLTWEADPNNPYDYVRIFRTINNQDVLLAEVPAGTLNIDIPNQYWGETLYLKAIAYDNCNNGSTPVYLQLDVPNYNDPCINDTIPPALVYNFNAVTSPQNLSLTWEADPNNPYDYVRIFRTINNQDVLLAEVPAGTLNIDIPNQYWGETLYLKAIAYDNCNNGSGASATQINIPNYIQLHCPAGALNYPDLNSSLHIINTSNQSNNIYIYAFDLNGQESWQRNLALSAKSGAAIESSGGISITLYSTQSTKAFIKMNGPNEASATYLCSSSLNNNLYIAENVCAYDWWSGSLLYNPSSEPATVYFESFPAIQHPNLNAFTIAPHASQVYIPPCASLAGTIHSNKPIIGMEIVGSLVETGRDIGVMLLPGQTSDTLFITGIQDGYRSWTGLALMAPLSNQQSTNISINKYFIEDGQEESFFELSPSSRIALNISEPDIAGMTARVANNAQNLSIAGMMLESSLAGFDLINPHFFSPSTEGVIVGFKNNAMNTIYFFNPTNEPASITCIYYDKSGQVIQEESFIVLAGAMYSSNLEMATDQLNFIQYSSSQPIIGLLKSEDSSSLTTLPFLRVN